MTDTMETPILTTKLYRPPPRAGLVPRARLCRELDAGLQRGHKLTLVAGPAGCGKTTLVSEWIHMRDLAVAWVSLDGNEDDPVRFWTYVVSALQRADPALGRTVAPVLRAPQHPAIDNLTIALINDLAERLRGVTTPLILVLDDYHTITTPEIHAALDLFIDHLPPSLHVILTSRSEPPLSLSRFRGRGQLTEITPADLRFTLEETQRLLNAELALDLADEEISALSERTEGWAVGLQLAALSLQRQATGDRRASIRAFTGNDRLIADYLVDEVLERQPAHIRGFLLETSILDRISSDLCDVLTERQDSRQIIARLDADNLFVIPLDSRRTWYRYHHLFAGLLRHRLAAQTTPERVAMLHRRASDWHAEAGFAEAAISHALRAGDRDRAVVLITEHIQPALLRGELRLAHHWLSALGEDMLKNHPILCIAQAWSTMSQSIELCRQWLVQAESLAEETRAGEDQSVVAHAAALRVAIARTTEAPPKQILALCRKALAATPAADSELRALVTFWMGQTALTLGDAKAAERAFTQVNRIERQSGNRTTTLAMNGIRAWRRLSEGRLTAAAAICRETLQAFVEPAEEAGKPYPMACYPYIVLGQVHLAWNELETATRYLTRGTELGALTTTERPVRDEGAAALARIHGIHGDFERGFALLAETETTSRLWLPEGGEIPMHRARLWLLKARIENDSRALAQAGAWAEMLSVDHPHDYAQDRLTRIEIRIEQQRRQSEPELEPVLQALDAELDRAKAVDHLRWRIEALTLKALALQVQRREAPAVAALVEALALAGPEHFVRHWLDRGSPMAQLLARVRDHARVGAYVRELPAEMPGDTDRSAQREAPPAAAPTGDPDGPIEPLTPREREILKIIAGGATNAEIAQDLHISMNTVKTHITHIFGKLGATHRTEAVARGRELALLD